MRLTVTTFVTMDGVMQSPGAPEEDPRNGFDLGGWLPPHFDEETGQYMNEVFDTADAFLLGRFSYQAMAAFWPQVTDPANRVAAQFNSSPKYVATATLADLAWAGAVPLRGDIPKQVAELKQAPAWPDRRLPPGGLPRSAGPWPAAVRRRRPAGRDAPGGHPQHRPRRGHAHLRGRGRTGLRVGPGWGHHR